MNILKFIYNREDKGLYRKRTIFGINITTKPIDLQILNKIQSCENKINSISNVQNMLTKLRTYEIYSQQKDKQKEKRK